VAKMDLGLIRGVIVALFYRGTADYYTPFILEQVLEIDVAGLSKKQGQKNVWFRNVHGF